MHPEQQADEVFITNSRPQDYHLIGWSTKRAGVQAFDRAGKPITYYMPVFAKRWEIEEALANGGTGTAAFKAILKESPKPKKRTERVIELD